MARTIAPNDPAPTRETVLFGKVYHWTWIRDTKRGRMKLNLHKGEVKGCRKHHRYQDGDRG